MREKCFFEANRQYFQFKPNDTAAKTLHKMNKFKHTFHDKKHSLRHHKNIDCLPEKPDNLWILLCFFYFSIKLFGNSMQKQCIHSIFLTHLLMVFFSGKMKKNLQFSAVVKMKLNSDAWNGIRKWWLPHAI